MKTQFKRNNEKKFLLYNYLHDLMKIQRKPLKGCQSTRYLFHVELTSEIENLRLVEPILCCLL